MKPSTLIKKKCKTDKQRLKVCYSLIDFFCGESEVEWAIQCNSKKKSS